jgi:uncharacterized membrane protein YdbT with pleckstrin-like domain
MPISTTNYELSDERLSITHGLLRQKNENILLYRVHNVAYRQGLRQRLVGQGNVILRWKDDDLKTTVIENVKNPRQVSDMILVLSENAKRRRRRGDRRLPHARYEPDYDEYVEADDEDDWY